MKNNKWKDSKRGEPGGKKKHDIISVPGLFLEESMINIFIYLEFNTFVCFKNIFIQWMAWCELIIK